MEPRFEFSQGALQVTLERGAQPREVVPVMVLAAGTAHDQDLDALIVISGLGDPADATAVCEALDEMVAGSAPPPSRIAFVACTYPQYSVYHFAEGYAARLGFVAKVTVSVREAREWLNLKARPARDVPGRRCALRAGAPQA